jgi:hypothetical protein
MWRLEFRIWEAITISCLLILSTCVLFVPSPSSDGHSVRVDHAPITIEGDGGFTAENGVVGGTGTSDDPYLISGWSIYSGDDHAFAATDTSACFLLKDCILTHGSSSAAWWGVSLRNVSNCTIQEVTASGFQVGMILRHVSDVAVRSCIISDSLNGVYVSVAQGFIEISNCEFHRCHQGMDLDYVTGGLEVSHNDMNADNEGSHGGPIHINRCSGGLVDGNRFDLPPGLVIQYSTGLTVRDNALSNSAIFIGGADAAHYTSNDIDRTNTVDGRPVLFLKDRAGGTIDCSDYGEVIGFGLSKVTLLGFSSAPSYDYGGLGIMIAFSEFVTINRCTVSHMQMGVYVTDSYAFTLRASEFSEGSGLFASRVRSLTVTQSVFTGDSGITLDSVDDFYIYHNDFMGVISESIKITRCFGAEFDDGPLTGGNYWLYEPHNDSDSDGFSDRSVFIWTGEEGVVYEDRYPLMNPYNQEPAGDKIVFWTLVGAIVVLCLVLMTSSNRKRSGKNLARNAARTGRE